MLVELDGSAMAAIPGDDLNIADHKAASVPAQPQAETPTMEKGDEPLSQHKEETAQTLGKLTPGEEGLSLFTKIGFVAIIVAVCAFFLRSPQKTTHAGRHGAYQQGMA